MEAADLTIRIARPSDASIRDEAMRSKEMSGRIQYRLGIVALIAGLAAAAASAQNETKIPDAQVESNVLRALASAPELSTQNIQSSTVYGTVTLSGNVHDETLRTKAENLVARAQGVKKVVDDLTLGDTPAVAANASDGSQMPESGDSSQPPNEVLQSDGTYAPAPGAQSNGSAAPDMQQNGVQSGPPPSNQQGQGYGQGYDPSQGPPPAQGQGYDQAQGAPPPQGQGYDPSQGQPPSDRRPVSNSYGAPQGGYSQPQGGPIAGGQQAGLPVTVPAGSMLRVRINRGLDSNHIQPGANFDGTVLTDVVAGGAVAIPRGAQVQGTVVDAKKAGVFKGQGELALQITGLSLGGRNYPLNSAVWQRQGRDKTAGTVNSAVGLGALGAVFGAVAGGGAGAAIGAGVGGAAGLAGSAATPRGQIIIPPESVLTFSTAQPVVVSTVSEQEMQRLAYGAGPVGQPRPVMHRRPYGPYGPAYYGPAY